MISVGSPGAASLISTTCFNLGEESTFADFTVGLQGNRLVGQLRRLRNNKRRKHSLDVSVEFTNSGSPLRSSSMIHETL